MKLLCTSISLLCVSLQQRGEVQGSNTEPSVCLPISPDAQKDGVRTLSSLNLALAQPWERHRYRAYVGKHPFAARRQVVESGASFAMVTFPFSTFPLPRLFFLLIYKTGRVRNINHHLIYSFLLTGLEFLTTSLHFSSPVLFLHAARHFHLHYTRVGQSFNLRPQWNSEMNTAFCTVFLKQGLDAKVY